MALMDQPDPSFFRLLGRLPCKRNITSIFQTDPYQRTSNRFGDIQARCNIAQAVWSMLIVQGDIKVRRHHRNEESGFFHAPAHFGQQGG